MPREGDAEGAGGAVADALRNLERGEAVRVALPGPDGPAGTFTRWENETNPW